MPDQSHIWQCPQCGTSVDISLYGFYTRVTCPSCASTQRVRTRLSNFRIEGMLGVGGMSLVFRGRDMVLDREVALKLLNDTYKTQDNRIARFERECALMARVRHRNVASIYAAGRVEEQFYIAMELVRGKNMEDLLVDGATIEQERALDIIMQVALGLNAAHQVGLLHRDVKPGNILLTENDEAKVIDFGLSLQSTDTDEEEMIWATPFYVPPETLRREPEDVRTDIYALGMTLRHLLTGSDKLGIDPSSADELLAAKRDLPPVCQLNKGISPVVGKLIDRMSAYSPDDRPANYQVLLTDMMDCVAQLRRKASLTSFIRSGRFMRRVLLCLGCAVAGGVAAFFALPMLGFTKSVSPYVLNHHPQLPSYKLLTQALKQGDWVKARAQTLKLRESSDSELAAWSGMIAWMLGYLSLDDENIQNQDVVGAKALLAKIDLELSPTTVHRKDLLSLSTWARRGTAPHVKDPLLLSIYEMMMSKGEGVEAQIEALDHSLSRLKLAMPPYDKLIPLLDSCRDSLKTPLITPESFAADRATLNFDKLMQLCASVEAQEEQGGFSAQYLQAVQQICRAGVTLLDIVSTGQDDWRALSQAEILEKMSAIDAMRYQELRCMCLLLQARYAEALVCNPHEPEAAFSVLMKHWAESLLSASDAEASLKSNLSL